MEFKSFLESEFFRTMKTSKKLNFYNDSDNEGNEEILYVIKQEDEDVFFLGEERVCSFQPHYSPV